MRELLAVAAGADWPQVRLCELLIESRPRVAAAGADEPGPREFLRAGNIRHGHVDPTGSERQASREEIALCRDIAAGLH